MIAQSASGSLSTAGHVFITVCAVVMLGFIFWMLRRGSMRSRYALLWTAVAVLLGVLVIFPGLLDRVSRWVGIYYSPALFLLAAVGFVFIVLIEFSRELTRLDERTRTLAEEIALLRAERADQAEREGTDAD